LSDLKILFVDDEKDTTDKYAKHLKRKYTNVYTSYDGLDAYKIYKEISPDVLVLDIYLPTMDGIDILRCIRKNDLNTKIIMITAHSEDRFKTKAVELGVNKYLVKPVLRSELKEALSLVDNKSLELKRKNDG